MMNEVDGMNMTIMSRQLHQRSGLPVCGVQRDDGNQQSAVLQQQKTRRRRRTVGLCCQIKSNQQLI